MIIIDQNAETPLAARLEKIKAHAENVRCIYFKLRGKERTASNIGEKITDAARQHILSANMQIYLCEDGDIFILAPAIPAKNGKQLIRDIADYTNQPATEEWVHFVELPMHANMLLIEVQDKLEKNHKADEAKRKLLEQQHTERKRQAILNCGVATGQEDIKNRRTGRKTQELMIIEDDTFSRRLVENVLSKHYALTGLAEATHALDTYARIAPDLLFLDIDLPDVTGHELLEKIIALDPDAYVIMLSGNSDLENITQAMNKGAKGFVAKPFTKDRLLQYIERCPTIALRQQNYTAS